MKLKKLALCAITTVAFLGAFGSSTASALVTIDGNDIIWSTQSTNIGAILALTDDVVSIPSDPIQKVFFTLSETQTFPTTLGVNFFGSAIGSNDLFTYNMVSGRYENTTLGIADFLGAKLLVGPNTGKVSFAVLGAPAGSVVTNVGVTIPEPSSALLGGLGLLALARRKRI